MGNLRVALNRPRGVELTFNHQDGEIWIPGLAVDSQHEEGTIEVAVLRCALYPTEIEVLSTLYEYADASRWQMMHILIPGPDPNWRESSAAFPGAFGLFINELARILSPRRETVFLRRSLLREVILGFPPEYPWQQLELDLPPLDMMGRELVPVNLLMSGFMLDPVDDLTVQAYIDDVDIFHEGRMIRARLSLTDDNQIVTERRK